MDKLGDWVYILLMVVVGISSLIGSINKKKRQQQTQMPLPEQVDPPYPTPSVPQQKERNQPAPATGQSKQKQPYKSLFSPSAKTTVSQTDILVEPEEVNTITDELELSDAEAFRKAIIYSEVLNRKY